VPTTPHPARGKAAGRLPEDGEGTLGLLQVQRDEAQLAVGVGDEEQR